MKGFFGAGILLLIISTIPAYITHIFWTFATLLGDASVGVKELAIMIIGIILPPFGIIHGYTIWF